MGLYTNGQIVPNLYNKKLQIKDTPNQDSFRVNYLQEVLQQQEAINRKLSDAYEEIDVQLTESFKDMHQILKRSSSKQDKDIVDIMIRLENQEEMMQQFLGKMHNQESNNKIILDRLSELEKRNIQIAESLKNESLINQAILDQVSVQHASTEALAGKINEFESIAENFSGQLMKQETIYEEISKQLEVQEVFHTTVMQRLDEQEALVQKIGRQLDNFRSVFFERVTYLSDKMESGIRQLVRPVKSYFIQPEEKEKSK
ncbi:hypothetical protein F7731_20725 [Cytobacillus depressus]|uniref:Uncharacterized protein n=1 Tax=Cytobacillus depressus TaxID=1602942 RepID=A0A6L3V557_9BACI|nr:hypothetical protein [Cytobacillus depressus]KAB2330208.1 hypothetical protein F7731_20725 [Cytobacillus depressus]